MQEDKAQIARPTNRLEHEAWYAYALAVAEKKGPSYVAALTRHLALNDLYFLLVFVLNRKDVRHDWLYARCMEVQSAPDGYVDLWARDHRKSTVITFAKTIQDVLSDPETTVGIFSHTRSAARAFLVQIKNELQTNRKLQRLFPEVLFECPEKQSPQWTQDAIVVKRKSNPKEATIEAWGLVEGQPIGRHFTLMVYDDVITDEECTNPDMIQKTTDAWAMSTNLVSSGRCRVRYIGTRYHLYDTWSEIIKREAGIPRIYPATDNGKADGKPVFLSQEALDEKKKQGSYIFSCQQLLKPIADEDQTFRNEWKRFWNPVQEGWVGMNVYILVDPAGSKKRKNNDFTSMWVIGLNNDGNRYVIDIVRDKLNLTERTEKLFELHRKYQPRKVGYEEYSMQGDIEHIKSEMVHKKYRFDIVELGGTKPSKEERIKALVPEYQYGRFYMPFSLPYTNYKGETHDLTRVFFEQEYDAFPVLMHDDMLDGQARILDPKLGAEFPKITKPDAHKKLRRRSAMTA